MSPLRAVISATPPVAQPFFTVTKGSPVSPSRETRLSGLVSPLVPPTANCTSVHARPQSASAPRTACSASSLSSPS